MFKNKANLFRFSHSKSNKFYDVSGYRESSLRAILTGLNAALLILIRFSQGCESLEQRRSSCRE